MIYFLKQYKLIILIIVSINLFYSCVEQFTPNISSTDLNKIVVNGVISDINELQTVYISKSVSASKPDYIPLGDCDVKVFDNYGNIFEFTENIAGQYEAYIDQQYLQEGTAYKIEIITSNGDLIVSNFDTLYHSPEIDTIYHTKKEIPTTNPSYNIQGIQFYIDYNGDDSNSKFIKWDIIETYEYHARFPKRWYIDDDWIHEINPPDYTKNVCWSTEKIMNIFTLSTKNLSENKYIKYPLHYVDNTTQRLAYGYSILVKQSSLSFQAFNYYEQLKLNILKNGGLYEKQPINIKGNLINTTNDEQVVLGFFQASGTVTKRIFVNPIEDFTLNYEYYCTVRDLLKVGLKAIRRSDYPADLWLDGGLFWIQKNCYDCTCSGGTLNKPSYWPN